MNQLGRVVVGAIRGVTTSSYAARPAVADSTPGSKTTSAGGPYSTGSQTSRTRGSAAALCAISGVILFIIVGATTFSQILTFSGATNGLVAAVQGARFGPAVVLAVMMLILLVLGCFIDQVSMMLITLPIFMPIVQRLGIDPVWFGVMFLICMQLGLLLPPHGLLLMTMRGVAPPQVTMTHIFVAVIPYVTLSLLVLALVFFVPNVATWLPKVLS